jgi:cytochrome c biogenesis protein
VEQSGLTSEGVIKVPDATPAQLGFEGVFLPSAADQGGRLVSVFPGPLRPMVSLVSYAGNLGLNSGASQSVYDLDLSAMHQLPVTPQPLAIGHSMQLPDGDGTITYTGYRQWVSLAVTYDPGQIPALISGCLALAGLILSFLVRRRRVFVRAEAGPGGSTLVEFGGLARSDAAGGFETEFEDLARDLRQAQDGSPVVQDSPEGSAIPDDSTAADPAEAPDKAPAGAAAGPASAEPVGAGTASSENDQSLGVADGE